MITKEMKKEEEEEEEEESIDKRNREIFVRVDSYINMLIYVRFDQVVINI